MKVRHCVFYQVLIQFSGDKLLTTPNPEFNKDLELFKILGIQPMKAYKKGDKPAVNERYKESPAQKERLNSLDLVIRLKEMVAKQKGLQQNEKKS